MDDFKPTKRVWYVERVDFRRTVVIVQTVEDDGGNYRFLVPTEHVPVGPRAFYSTGDTMTGNQPYESLYRPGEAQQLLDALWQAGLRPTRR